MMARAPKRTTPFTEQQGARYQSVLQISIILNVQPSKIRGMIRSGELPAVYVRGQYRVRIADFERFLTEAARRSRRG